MIFRWTYNHREGGADVFRFTSDQHGPGEAGEWVANCANGLIAQALCTYLAADDATNSLPLDLNPPRLYRKP